MKRILSSCFLMLVMAFQLQASQGINNTPDFMLRTLVGADRFEGDRHNDFAGDSVAILSDGSRWKVHPKDTEKFSEWGWNEIVHARLRTSFYWFKREHKFELYNHSRREAVRVMLVEYPYTATYITNFQDVEVSRYMDRKPMKDDCGIYIRDSNGKIIYEYYWVITYHRDIYLSDGSALRVEKDIESFTLGKFVYLGLNNDSDGLFYFLISGTEREALWTPVKFW